MDRVWTTQKKTECGLYKKKKKTEREREKDDSQVFWHEQCEGWICPI